MPPPRSAAARPPPPAAVGPPERQVCTDCCTQLRPAPRLRSPPQLRPLSAVVLHELLQLGGLVGAQVLRDGALHQAVHAVLACVCGGGARGEGRGMREEEGWKHEMRGERGGVGGGNGA